ncbi:ABC transporter permease [Aquabacter sp. CN5-332]|uniref:ABC transporter permease n=1 Tax=Aquabacter sp. CN5-332 TaxID=3156608 RepID=UPI0032B3D888
MTTRRPSRKRRRLPLGGTLSVQAGRIVLAAIVFALWEFGSGRLFDAFYFSKPSLIFLKIASELGASGFYVDLLVTAQEMVAGYTIGAVAGVALGVLLARWDYVANVLSPFLLALNSIPRIALAPMLIVWFGIGMASKVFLGATLVFFITFFNTLSGVRGVDKALCDVARVQGATQWQIFTKVMLPSASSWILTGLKMSLPFALVGVILGEFLVSSKGLGYRLNAYSTGYDTTGALAMVFVMMIIMMALTAGVDAIEARVLRWRPRDNDNGQIAPRA